MENMIQKKYILISKIYIERFVNGKYETKIYIYKSTIIFKTYTKYIYGGFCESRTRSIPY